MADLRFHTRAGPFKLSFLAEIAGAHLSDEKSGELEIIDVAPLDEAGPGEISFFENTAYMKDFEQTGAAACIIHPKHAERAPEGVAQLHSEEPYKAYARIAQAFYSKPAADGSAHPTAIIDPTAKIGEGCQIGPYVVIEANVEIGARAVIDAGALISRSVRLGDDCRIGAQVSLSHCLIGNRVSIYPGARIGQDGFGFAPDPAAHVKVPQIGRVIIEDDCEIGANTTIDRGSLKDTVIGTSCWIDNLVQIGHNVTMGRGCIIVAQAGFAGSTQLGNYVAAGGQVGLAGHLKIGDGVQIAAKSGVMSDIPAGTTVAGIPATSIREHFKQVAYLRRMTQKKKGKNDG